jgi:hypothetical protein
VPPYQLDNPYREKGLVVWLDDVRPMPSGYDLHITNAEAMIVLLRHDHVRACSLDHDLGKNRLDGTDLVKFLLDRHYEGLLQTPIRFRVHTGNPPAGLKMVANLQLLYRRWDVDWPRLQYTPED